MSMLTVRLTDEDEEKLDQILTATNVEKSQLIRKLINDQWIAVQGGKTFLERRGGHPKHTLNESADLSSRNKRKKITGQAFEAKSRKRKGS